MHRLSQSIKRSKYTRGYTPTEAGRRYGVGSSTVCKWVKKARVYGYKRFRNFRRDRCRIHGISPRIERVIVEKHLARGRCAEVVHQELRNE